MNNVLVAAKLCFPRLECTVLESLGSRCHCLHFCDGSLGTPSAPMRFPRNLTSLTVLWLSGGSFHIVLPQTMQLTDLRIEAGGSLEMSIYNVGALSNASILQDLYRQLKGPDPLRLFLLLAAAGQCMLPIDRSWRKTRGMQIKDI